MDAQSSPSEFDSLHQVLDNEKMDTQRVHLMNTLASSYRFVDLVKAEQLANSALDLSREVAFPSGEIQALYMAAIISRLKGDAEGAVLLGKQSMDLAEKHENWPLVGRNCNSLGNAYCNLGKYDTAVIFYFKALEGYEKSNHAMGIASVYNNLGDTFYDQDKDDLGIEYTKKALEIYEEKGEMKRAAVTLMNLGKMSHDDQIAMDYFQRALSIHQENNDLRGVGGVNANIGSRYMKLEDYEAALPHFQEALRIAEQMGNQKRAASAKSSLGKIYFYLKQPVQAIQFCEEALSLSKAIGFQRETMETHNNLARFHADQKQFEKAYYHLSQAKILNDSLKNKTNLEITSELEAKYDAKQKEAELASQQLEIERQKNAQNRLLIFGGLLFLGLLAIFQWYFYRQKRKKRETELALEFQKAEAENLRDLDNIKTKFFANISHELRTPLTLIISPLEDLIDKMKGKSRQDELHLAHTNSKKLLGLVNEILDLSKLEAGKLELHETAVNLNHLTRRIFYSFQSLAHLRGISLSFENGLPEDLGLQLDIEKYEKILNNLLSNAIKYSETGGSVQLAVGSRQFAAGNLLVVSVHDSGQGIPKEELEKVFDRFYQSSSGKMSGGTGIGLALSKELALLFGGDLKVESELGKGSIFTLEIPLKEAMLKNLSFESEEPAEFPELNQQEEASIDYKPILLNGDKSKILIVEDNLEMSEFLHNILSPYYECTKAFNGKEALQKLEEGSYDLITSDVMMPEMDGFEFREIMSKRTDWSQTPFIMLTARALEDDRLQGLSLGVDDYITKPFSSKELLARIDNLLRNKSERAQFQKENAGEKTDHPESADRQLLKAAESIVLENLDEPQFKVTDLAKEIGYSQRQLSRIIKKLTGLSPVGFILEIRLQKARQMLETRQFMTVSEVRYEVGIESPAYFTTKFKERFGKSPKELLVV